MHRLVVNFYKAPVAVNDLGWVAYGNPDYVLDLVGLGSEETRHAHLRTGSSADMDRIVSLHGVGWAMIYTDWFSNVPSSWVKVAQLSLHGGWTVSAARAEVDFVVTSREATSGILAAIRAWRVGLQSRDTLVIYDDLQSIRIASGCERIY